MTSWPFNFPAAVLQSALECIEKRRAMATGAARDASPPEEDNDDPGKGPEEFENFDPSRDDEDEASPSRRQRSMGSGNRRRVCLTAPPRTPQGPNVQWQRSPWRCDHDM